VGRASPLTSAHSTEPDSPLRLPPGAAAPKAVGLLGACVRYAARPTTILPSRYRCNRNGSAAATPRISKAKHSRVVTLPIDRLGEGGMREVSVGGAYTSTEETHGFRSRGVWKTPLRRVGLRRVRSVSGCRRTLHASRPAAQRQQQKQNRAGIEYEETFPVFRP
jgi:hypothetical protein